MWAKKISTSATAVACAACLATAAALPVMGEAADQLARKISSADVRLSVDFSQLDAFNAIPLYLALFGGDMAALEDLDSLSAIPALIAALGGDVAALGDLDSVSAIPALIAALGGDVDALGDLDSVSAVPALIAVLGGDVDALGDLDSVSAVPALIAVLGGDVAALGDLDSVSAVPSYIAIAGGDIDATGDLDSVSAIRTFFGSDGVFGAGGIDALLPNGVTGQPGYAALSAIPAYLAPTPAMATAATAAPEETSPPSTGSGPVGSPVNALTSALPGGGTGTQSPPSFAPQVQQVQQQVQSQVQPQVEELKPTADVPGNSGANSQNLTRDSQKYEPTTRADSPFLFGGGGQGVDNGIRGWGEALNKLGLGGGEEPSGGDPEGAE